MRPLPCVHGRCTRPAAWTVEAGRPDTGWWYTAGTCDTHRTAIEKRATKHTQGQPAIARPISSQSDHEQQEQQLF